MHKIIIAIVLSWSFSVFAQDACYRTCQAYVEKGLFDTLMLDKAQSLESSIKSWACKQTFEELKKRLNVESDADVLGIVTAGNTTETQEDRKTFESFCKSDKAALSLSDSVRIFQRTAPKDARDVFGKCVATCTSGGISELKGGLRHAGGRIQVSIQRKQISPDDKLKLESAAVKGMSCGSDAASAETIFRPLESTNDLNITCDWEPNAVSASVSLVTSRGSLGDSICKPVTTAGKATISRTTSEPGWVASDPLCLISNRTANNHNKKCKSGCPACSNDGQWCADWAVVGANAPNGHRFTGGCPASVSIQDGPGTHWDQRSCDFQNERQRAEWRAVGNTHPQQFRVCFTTEKRATLPITKSEEITITAGRFSVSASKGQSVTVDLSLSDGTKERFAVGGSIPSLLVLDKQDPGADGAQIYHYRLATPCDIST